MTEEKIGPIRKVLLLSGGVDSAFLLSKSRLRQLGPRRNRTGMLCPVFVGYGQPAEKSEWLAAQQLAEAMRVPIMRIDVSGIDLGDMASEVASRVVPARNMWLIALAAALVPPAKGNVPQLGFSENEVWIGAAPQDHADYPDCREGFLSAMRVAALRIGVDLRWSDASREERVEHLREQNLLDITHSCYSNIPCGDCPSCLQ
jgi:7-cyano-7-deazaguanine synthase in queuosine biosynthesis